MNGVGVGGSEQKREMKNCPGNMSDNLDGDGDFLRVTAAGTKGSKHS